ncbi:hypothetical protein MTO96_023596 [Rhipicephalus appendiculatus]
MAGAARPVVQALQPPALRQQTKRPTGRAALNASSSDAPESAHSARYTEHRRSSSSAGDAVNSPGVVRLAAGVSRRTSAGALLLLCGYLAASIVLVSAAPSKEGTGKSYEDSRLKLIVKAFADELVRELSSALDKGHVELIKEKLDKLPDHIQEHPAIGQKHLWVGKGKPPASKDAERKERHALANRRKWAMHKRDGALVLPSEEICQTTTQWEQLNRTQDYDGNEVEIVQDEIQQYVFSYRCATCTEPLHGHLRAVRQRVH